jgi:hypothetical protein
MVEMESVSVEHRSGELNAEVLKVSASGVLAVTSDGVADVGEVDSDLVGSACQRLDAQV